MIVVAVFSLIIILVIVKWLQEKNRYWEKRNVKHLPPKLFVGNSYESLIGRKHIGEIIEQAYLRYPNEDVVGHYEFMRPQLIIRKPEIIESILIKDFSHFTDRGATPSGKNPLAINLFNMSGKQWRAFRYKLSPIFTSGKLKSMFGPLAGCGQNLTVALDENNNKEVDMREIMSLFSIDVIGSCAFGIDPGVMQNPSSEFRAKAKNIFSFSISQYFRIMISLVAPDLVRKLGISFIKPSVVKYFCNIILNTLQFRQKHNIVRNDFVQMLLQLKTLGKIELQVHEQSDEFLELSDSKEIYEFKITDELLMGTAFGFISAGFHTTASTLTYVLYELALQPDILHKVRREIKDQIAIHGGINYDALRCMIYLEKVIKETMRLHPAAVLLLRMCTKAYTLPNGLKVDPGETVIIPVLALHRDPFLHKDAYSFNPDRFDTPPAPSTFLPFGEGPRICIAMRFAMLEMKFAISKLLANYDIELSKKTRIPLKMSPRGFLNTPKNEVYFKITKIKKDLS